MSTSGKAITFPASEEITTDPVAAAAEAGLRYVNDAQPGYTRKRNSHGFVYRDREGKIITDKDLILRIDRLVIPPAWTDVWICSSPNGHLQATGRDARRRKQYRYHHRWRKVRDATKFDRMLTFARALPRIRQRVKRDLKLKGLPRNKVLATVVRLLETTLIRIGNNEYARENHSYGLTTMHTRHAKVSGSVATFSFNGKGNRRHVISVEDPTLAKVVKRCRDLPGYELFQYLDDAGERQSISSSDVNKYLQEISNEDFTAKDFRTWAGTVLTLIGLGEQPEHASETEAKKCITESIKATAKLLGNTPAICRKCYVHPAILDSYLAGSLVSAIRQSQRKGIPTRLKWSERAVAILLRRSRS